MASHLQDYAAYRRALGYAKKGIKPSLLAFDRYLIEQSASWDQLQPVFFLQLRAKIADNPKTVNNILMAVRSFFQFLVRQGICAQNPLKDIPPLSKRYFVPFVFSPDQVEMLLNSIQKQIRTTRECFFLRDMGIYTGLYLMARCGLRISEPFRIMDEHWRKKEMTLYIEKTKFNKDRLIPVPKTVPPFIENFLSVRKSIIGKLSDCHLLTIRSGVCASKQVAYQYFHRAVKEIGIIRPRKTIGTMTFGHPTPHSLRHSFAVNTLKAVRERGRSAQNALPIMAAYLGHTDWRYTIKYLQVIDAKQGQALVDFCVKHKREFM